MHARLKVGWVILSLVLFGACQSKEQNGVLSIDAPAFSAQLNAQKDSVLLIDVRTPEEFNSGHLPGAILVDFKAPDFAEKISNLPKDKKVYVYCRSGRRSLASAELFVKAGFKTVTNLTPGILGWQSENLPVVME